MKKNIIAVLQGPSGTVRALPSFCVAEGGVSSRGPAIIPVQGKTQSVIDVAKSVGVPMVYMDCKVTSKYVGARRHW